MQKIKITQCLFLTGADLQPKCPDEQLTFFKIIIKEQEETRNQV